MEWYIKYIVRILIQRYIFRIVLVWWWYADGESKELNVVFDGYVRVSRSYYEI